MPPGISHIIAFIAGGIIFRYFEEIRESLLTFRAGLDKAMKQHQNNIKKY